MASVPSTKPPPGFMMWVSPYGTHRSQPHHFEVVEVWNAYNLERYLLEPKNMHPGQNVANLYWRPVKAFGEPMN